MKLKVKAIDIQRAVKQCVNAIDPKDQIRSNIMFEADDNILRIKATNTQYSIERTCPCDMDEEGIATVDGKMVYNVIAKANGDCLFNADITNMTIKTSGRTKLPNIHRDLPMIDNVVGKNVVFNSVEFKNAIQKIDYAISEDQSRLVLTGAHMVTDGTKATITALDGFRLAQTEIECTGDNLDVIIPLRILSAVCDSITDGDLSVVSNNNRISFSGDGFIINAVTLSGSYIDTSRIIPTTFKTNVLIKTADIKDCADSATVASGSTNLVKFEIANDKLTIKSNSEEADFQGDVSAMYDGDDITIAFNLKYLIQSFAHIDTEQCEIKLNTAVSPVIIVPHSSEKNDLHLILPVRVFA